jgi:hypothetical protein
MAAAFFGRLPLGLAVACAVKAVGRYPIIHGARFGSFRKECAWKSHGNRLWRLPLREGWG